MSRLPEDYVPVSARIQQFREVHPEGFIVTEATTTQYGEENGVRFVAKIYRNMEEAKLGVPAATGHAELILDNDKVLEKAETVAVGRAIANLGFSIQGGIASQEEMESFQEKSAPPKRNFTPSRFPQSDEAPKVPQSRAVESNSQQLNELKAARGASASRLPSSFKK